MGDLAGNDVGWYIRKRRYVEKPDIRYSKTADLLCEMGRFGQKTGAGWYDYVPGKRDAIPSKVVTDMIEKHRAELGITARKISDEEIVQRLVYALVNEGAKIVDEGIAMRASDIDMVYLTGYGFPLFRGGPMNYADRWGCSTSQGRSVSQANHDDASSEARRRCSRSWWPGQELADPDLRPHRAQAVRAHRHRRRRAALAVGAKTG
jgi:3-hydroxyacyl-CoA dehydrogenase